MMAENQPTVGRVAHYVSYGTPNGEYKSVCRAAIVTEVGRDGAVSLCVLTPPASFSTWTYPSAPVYLNPVSPARVGQAVIPAAPGIGPPSV